MPPTPLLDVRVHLVCTLHHIHHLCSQLLHRDRHVHAVRNGADLISNATTDNSAADRVVDENAAAESLRVAHILPEEELIGLGVVLGHIAEAEKAGLSTRVNVAAFEMFRCAISDWVVWRALEVKSTAIGGQNAEQHCADRHAIVLAGCWNSGWLVDRFQISGYNLLKSLIWYVVSSVRAAGAAKTAALKRAVAAAMENFIVTVFG